MDIFNEVNRLSKIEDVEDVEKLTEEEVAELFAYSSNNDKLPVVKKILSYCKNDKIKLMYLRNLLTSGMSQNRKCVLILP
jgi:hypothetical protein